jgi:peptidoglycan/LPS O-acetylase OafA/YrhL
MKKPAGRFTVPQVDALRVLAMLGIFTHHLWGGRTGEGLMGASLAFLCYLGQFGVVFFNLMTGFVLALPCLGHECRPEPGYVGFLKRRFLRIAPAYYLAAVLFTGLNFVFFSGLDVSGSLSRLLGQILFVQGLDPSSLYTNTAAYWYLTLLAEFYLVYPLILRLFMALGAARACLLVFGVCWGGLSLLSLPSFGLQPWLQSVDSMLYFNLPARLPEFAMGMWLAAAWRPGMAPSQGAPVDRPFMVFTGALILVSVLMTPWTNELALPHALFYQVSCCAGVFVTLFLWPRVAEWGRSRWVRSVSAASYGIYLVHQPIASYWGALSGGWSGQVAQLDPQLWFLLSLIVLAPPAFLMGRHLEPAAAFVLSLPSRFQRSVD